MISRVIDLDEETDQILAGLARDHAGDRGKALAGLLKSFESMEAFADASESFNHERMRAQKENSENAFREGRGIPWEQVKRENNL